MARYTTSTFILVTMCVLLVRSYNALGQVAKGLVVTTPSLNLQNGTSEGILPCTVNNTLLLHGVSWSKGTSVQTAELVIYLDVFFNPGERIGPGFEDGSFDITQNFSLIIKDVSFQDAGQYLCSAESTSGDKYWAAANVTVFEPPTQPYPLIQECIANKSMSIDLNCTKDTPSTEVNITCSVHGYSPEYNVNFHHEIHPVRLVLFHEWHNADGLKSKSVTVQVVSDPIPYECIATGIDSSGEITDRTASILLKSTPREISSKPNNTVTIIAITMAVLIAVIICASVFFLVRKVRKDGINILNRRKKATFQSLSREMEIIADISTSTEGQKNGTDQNLDYIPNIIQQLVTSYHSVEKWQENIDICYRLTAFFESQGAILQRTRFDSIHFYVKFRTAAKKVKFLKACDDWTLSTGLANLLVTPELERKAGVKLEVNIVAREVPLVEKELPRKDSSNISFYQERKTIVFHGPSHNVDDGDIGKTLHSQRPVETDDDDKHVEQLKQWKTDLCHHYHNILGHMQTNPRDPDSVVDLQSIYIDPVVARGLTTATTKEKPLEHRAPGFFLAEPLSKEKNKYAISHEGFQELLSPGIASKKVLLVGEAGIGKTTFIVKLVHDWMAGKEMKTTKLLLYIPLAKTKKRALFSKCVQEYLSDSNLRVSGLDEYIAMNQAKVMFIFDGLDDYEVDITQSDPNNAVVQIMRGEMFEDSVVLVSSRPWRVDQILGDEKLHRLFTCTSIQGFDKTSAKDYVSKFFKEDQSSCKGLHEFIEDDSKEGGIFSTIMATNPMYVAMVCHMWRDNPRDETTWKLETVAQLINEMVVILKAHLSQKSKAKSAEALGKTMECTGMALVEAGRIAYKNLLKDRNIVIDREDCLCLKTSIDTAFSVGILTKVKYVKTNEEDRDDDEREENEQQQRRGEKQRRQQRQQQQQRGERIMMETRFPNRLMQDYLAAVYIASLYREDPSAFQNILRVLLSQSKDDLTKFEFLWYLISARSKEVGRATMEFLRREVTNLDFIVRVAFECHDKDVVLPAINAVFTKSSLALESKQSFAAHLFLLNNVLNVETLQINVLPESKMLARTAAQTIFTLERLRTVDIRNCGSYSEVFYTAMNMTSSTSPSHIQNLRHFADKLSAFASLNYARAICSMTSLKVLTLSEVKMDDVFYETMAQESNHCQIQNVYHYNDKLSALASLNYARAICSMTSLNSFMLQGVETDDIFYETMAHESHRSQIQYLFHNADKLTACASLNYARAICSMTSLNMLMLHGVEMDDVFYETMAQESHHSQLSTVKLLKTRLKRRNLRALLSLKSLRTAGFIQVTSTAKDVDSTSDNSSDVGAGSDERMGDSSVRSGRHNSSQHVSSECAKQQISMDDLSLPHLLQLGLHTQSSKVETICLNCTQDVTNDVMVMLQGFPSLTKLYITGSRQHEQSVSLKDTSELCNIMTSFHDLTTLGITDVSIGDDEARQILEMTRNHRHLNDLSITRCDTTDVLDPLRERIRSETHKRVKISHGKPNTKDDADDDKDDADHDQDDADHDQDDDYIHRIHHSIHFDDLFTVMTVAPE